MTAHTAYLLTETAIVNLGTYKSWESATHLITILVDGKAPCLGIGICTDCDKGKHPDEIYKYIMGKDYRSRWRKNIGEFYAEEGYAFPVTV